MKSIDSPDDMQAFYCRTLCGAVHYNDLCIEYMNSLIRFYPVPVRSLTGRLLDQLYESRDALIENRENLLRLQQLICSLD